MIKTALILAGGFGTRLKHIVSDVPKPLAPVNNKPFLSYLIESSINNGIKRIILLTGYKSYLIEEFVQKYKDKVEIIISKEENPLGTGGAVKKAVLDFNLLDPFFLLNGDTYFDFDYEVIEKVFKKTNSHVIVASMQINKNDRYGLLKVRYSNEYFISEFLEKTKSGEQGLINAGVYLINPIIFNKINVEEFSLETMLLPSLVADKKVITIPFPGRFIDIGIPEDFNRANKCLDQWIKDKKNKIKVCFLDRDGVVNIDTKYTHKVEELELLNGLVPFLISLKKSGYKFIIVTNQAGIAKGVFSKNEYIQFQNQLLKELDKHGIEILDSYYCPYHEEGCIEEFTKVSFNRKPDPGMILTAASKHNIDLCESIMIGDKDSDRIRLSYLKSFIIEGNYPVNGKSYKNFDKILEDL